MTCPKCNSDNVNIKIINDNNIKIEGNKINKFLVKHSPKLLFKLNKNKIKVIENKFAVCNNCGNKWRI